MNYNQIGSKPIVSIKWVVTLTLFLAFLLGYVICKS